MAEVDYLLLCDYAISGEGGKQIIAGTFERVQVSAFPSTHPVMFIAARIQGTPHEVVPFQIEIGRPNGDILQRLAPPEIVLSADGLSHLNIQFVGLIFPEQGRYVFKIVSNGRALASRSLRVVLMQQQPPPPQRPH
jgi:hypothetical protein